MKYKWDNKNVLDYAVSTAEAKSIEKGIEQGKLEEAIVIAGEMKKYGLPLSQIAKFTKLTIEEIENL